MSDPVNQIFVDGPIAITGDNLNAFTQTTPTAPALRNFIGISGMSVTLLGISAIGDNLGGTFYWNATSTGPDDNSSVIVPFGAKQGAWVKVALPPVGIGFASIAALRAYVGSPAPSAYVEGYYVPGDAGGGSFTYVASDTTSADNGGTIIVDAGGRRWYRMVGSGPISVKWFGAKGDGATNDLASIQATYNAIPAVGGVVSLPTANYIVSAPITVTGNNIITDGNNSQITTTSATADIYRLGLAGGNIARLVFRNLSFYSTVTKSAGACVKALASLNNTNFNNVQFGSLDLTSGGPSKLWDGLDVTASFNRVLIDNESVCCVANHGVRAAGTVALPAAELQLNHRTIGGARGVYIGGAAGGVYSNGEISSAIVGVYYDSALAGVTNREGFTQPGCVIDSCRDYGIYVAPDSLAIFNWTGSWVASTGAVVAGNGVGIFFDQNAGPTAYCEAVMSGGRLFNSAATGLVNAGALLNLSGAQINNNAAGVIIEGMGAQGSAVIANTFANNSGAALTFQNGITDYTADANNFIANGTNIVAALAWTATAAIRNNLGYQTRNSGSLTIPAGTNPTVVVNHGLVTTPFSVTLGPDSAIQVGIILVAPTTFTLQAFGTVGTGGIGVTWMADMGTNS